jgi:hypothetical protein
VNKAQQRRELWRQRVAQQGKSGQSIRVFCREQRQQQLKSNKRVHPYSVRIPQEGRSELRTETPQCAGRVLWIRIAFSNADERDGKIGLYSQEIKPS